MLHMMLLIQEVAMLNERGSKCIIFHTNTAPVHAVQSPENSSVYGCEVRKGFTFAEDS